MKTNIRRTAQIVSPIVALTFLLALTSEGGASTFVSGNVSGTWNKAGSPYIATGNCTVPGGESLTIEPGVTVIIGQGLRVDVLGSIFALGSASERITVRGATPSAYWSYIAVYYSGSDSRFQYCNISDATNGVYLGISASDRTMAPELSNCTFSNCVDACIYGYSAVECGFGYSRLNATINNCRFYSSSNGVRFTAESCAGTVSPMIANSLFHGIADTAIWFDVRSGNPDAGQSSPKVLNSVFIQCPAAVRRGGAANQFSAYTVANCIFSQCGTAIQRDINESEAGGSNVGYNDFYNNQTNFVGYPAGVHGTICCQNNNGTACDLLFNIFQNPNFAETTNYTLSPGSPCIDAGDPSGAYLDSCTNSLGTTVNDIGLYGGPGACGWIPSTNTSFTLSAGRFVGVTITPSVPGRYRLEYRPNVDTGVWTQATNVTLLSTPFTWIDFVSPTTEHRFYRAVLLP